MSVRNGLLTVPEDGELLRIPGFYPGTIPPGREEKTPLIRTVLHEWPLSRVEAAEFADLSGNRVRRIVKIQHSPASAEGDFYRYAAPLFREGESGIRIPELLGAERAGDCEWLILSFEEGAPEDWSGLTEDGIRARVREIVSQLPMQGLSDATVFTDWSAPERFAADLGEDVPALLAGGLDDPARIQDWAERGGAVCWEAPVGFLHADLKADNLLITESGAVLLDWQRPARAPLPLEEELSVLLERGIPDPGSLSAEIRPFAALALFFEAHWYAWARRTCLPYPFVLKQAVKYAAAGLALIQ